MTNHKVTASYKVITVYPGQSELTHDLTLVCRLVLDGIKRPAMLHRVEEKDNFLCIRYNKFHLFTSIKKQLISKDNAFFKVPEGFTEEYYPKGTEKVLYLDKEIEPIILRGGDVLYFVLQRRNRSLETSNLRYEFNKFLMDGLSFYHTVSA